MSWAEVFKINKNMKRSINEQLRDMKYNPIRVITASTTYTPEKTGVYKVICVGEGGSAGYYTSDLYKYALGGGGGGVAIKTMMLDSAQSYNVTVSSTASFGNELTATAGTAASQNSNTSAGSGGTASGGDYNFAGSGGSRSSSYTSSAQGGSVGVAITDLSRKYIVTCAGNGVEMYYGDSILNYGGGGPAALYSNSGYPAFDTKNGLPAAVIIIPLEMEE